jgi:plastocyanin
MDRRLQTILAGVAAAVTVAVGVFALSRAMATDEPLVLPVAVTTTVAGAAPASGAPDSAGVSAAPVASSAGPAEQIEIVEFSFSSPELTIAAGTTVEWTNSDQTEHSIVFVDGSASSPTLGQGDTFSFTFTTPGEYAYICGFHTAMTGTITVTA